MPCNCAKKNLRNCSKCHQSRKNRNETRRSFYREETSSYTMEELLENLFIDEDDPITTPESLQRSSLCRSAENKPHTLGREPTSFIGMQGDAQVLRPMFDLPLAEESGSEKENSEIDSNYLITTRESPESSSTSESDSNVSQNDISTRMPSYYTRYFESENNQEGESDRGIDTIRRIISRGNRQEPGNACRRQEHAHNDKVHSLDDFSFFISEVPTSGHLDDDSILANIFTSTYPDDFPTSDRQSNNLRQVFPDRNAFCPICLRSYKRNNLAVEFLCNHLFHLKCASRWLRVQNTCPICRRNLD